MGLINYTTSGDVQLSFPQGFGEVVGSGNLYIMNEEISRIEKVIPFDLSDPVVPVTLTGAHVSKTNYQVIPTAFGYSGHSRVYDGFIPGTSDITTEYLQNAGSLDVSGTLLFSKDFEDNDLSDLIVSYSGGGSIGSSGILSDSLMKDTRYFGFNYTLGVASFVLEPVDPATSGITCGRATFLTRNGLGTNPNSTQENVGFMFMRQSPTTTGVGYKLAIRPNNTTQYRIESGTTQLIIQGSPSAVHLTDAFFQSPIEFDTTTIRNNNRTIWCIVEWEVLPSLTAVIFNNYYKVYEDGDTVENIKTNPNTLLLNQVLYAGTANGENLFTSTDYKPAWFITGNGSAGVLGLDELYLESLPSLARRGLFRAKLFDSSQSPAAPRPFITNDLVTNNGLGNKVGRPSVPFLADLVSADISPIGVEGCGHLIKASDRGGSVGISVFELDEPGADSITAGVFRVGLRLNVSVADTAHFGFTFMRQGNLLNSNAYTLEMFRNGADDFRVRLRKGTVVNVAINGGNFTGTILSTSSNLGITQGTDSIIEIRWKAGVSSMQVEVLQCTTLSGDSSPGTVDYKLTPKYTYTDSVSPYLTTSENPLMTFRAESTSDRFLLIHGYSLRKET